MIIGLSTGCFHKWDSDVYDKIGRIIDSKAEAIEVNIGNFSDFMALDSESIGPEIGRMKIISIHLPWSGILYGDNKETEAIMEKMEEIKNTFNVNSFTIHADLIDNLDIFEKFDLLVENLNSAEKFGSGLHDIKKIKEIYNPNFVLDIAHVYQMDKSMKDMPEIIEILGEDLKMLHVSGFKDGNQHAMVLKSESQAMIEKWVKKLRHLPIILEGQIPNHDMINLDIELIKAFLSK